MRSNAPRSHAELHVRDDLALDPLEVGQNVHENAHHNRGFNQAEKVEIHDWTVPPGIWPLGVGDWALTSGPLPPYNPPGDSMTALRILE